MTDLSTESAAVVASLADAWAAKDLELICSHFHDDATYHNMPMEPSVGIDAIREAIDGFLAMADTIIFETTHQVVDGNLVMNERVDTFTTGDNAIAIAVMGVFHLRDGKIEAWRDYFDMSSLTGA